MSWRFDITDPENKAVVYSTFNYLGHEISFRTLVEENNGQGKSLVTKISFSKLPFPFNKLGERYKNEKIAKISPADNLRKAYHYHEEAENIFDFNPAKGLLELHYFSLRNLLQLN